MTELTPAEVTALFDLDEGRVRKDVEYGVFDQVKGPPRFDFAKIVYLCTLAELSLDLGIADRKRIYLMIENDLKGSRRQDLHLSAHVVVKLGDVVRAVETRMSEFAKWKSHLVAREDILGGELTFPKSRLAVRHIGEMARRGAAVEEILEDYPALRKNDVEFAKRYVVAYPRVGRPRAREATAR